MVDVKIEFIRVEVDGILLEVSEDDEVEDEVEDEEDMDKEEDNDNKDVVVGSGMGTY